jgi:lysophospholipase L1-like esterase
MAVKFKELKQNLLIFSGTVILFSVLAELILRAMLPPLIEWKVPQEVYQYDSQTGHWLEPNQQANTHSASVITNSEGLRDRDYTPKASNGAIRILAFGDSQTFGNGIELVETWPKQLEQVLNSTDKNKNYEVINAGLAGTDTWQHEIILERLLPKYNPDIVVLAFYVNDAVKKFTPSPEMKSKQEAGQNRLVYTLKKSALLMSLRTAVGAVKNMLSPAKGFLMQQALLKGEDNPVLQERWQQVAQSIASMQRTSNVYKTRFMIFSIPRRDQIDGRMPWDSYYGKLTAIAEQNQVPVYSMLKPLQAAYKDHGRNLFIPWDGHNTAIANQVIAESLGKKILNE